MEKYNWKSFSAAFEARTSRERVVMLAAIAALVVYLWLMFLFDPMNADRADLNSQIKNTGSQIVAETNRYIDIQNSYTSDPDVTARLELKNLQDATQDIDGQLSTRYEQLILPREMAQVLTTVLQRETSLQLVGVENLKPESLIIASVNTAVPLVGATTPGVVTENAIENGVEVFKHGLTLHLRGEYLEVIRYLQSLEELESGFFWEAMSFEAGEFPDGKMSLNIFTLSTNRGWIGV